MRNAWVIARREYNHYFSTTVSYSVALTILFVLGAIFFLVLNQAIQNAFNGGSTAGAAVAPDIKVIAVWFTIMSVLTVPALTMRLISDENRMGTLELLLTAPLQDWELIVGKWLGALLFLLTILAVTLVYPIILNIYETPGTNLQWQVLSLIILSIALIAMFWNLVIGERLRGLFILFGIWIVAIIAAILLYKFTVPGIDWGLTLSIYIGLFLVCAAFLAIGVGMSSLFSNQIAAFIVTILAFVFLWWILGFITEFTQGIASGIFGYLDMGSHFNNDFIAGTIDLPDLIYYLSLTALGLFIGTTAVESRRWS
jgi:ABC-2 type transport system permease protein